MYFEEIIQGRAFTFRMLSQRENKEAIYRLRYQVYAHECAFIDPNRYPEGLETDRYDNYARHFAVSDEDVLVGTVRLILNSDFGFPIEEYCPESFRLHSQNTPKHKLAEISRLVISKELRQKIHQTQKDRHGEPGSNSLSRHSESPMPCYQKIAGGLYRLIYRECVRQKISTCFAVMARSLQKLVARQGIHWQPIGDEVNFYGPVRPHLLDLQELASPAMEREQSIPSALTAYLVN